jgi:DNA-binding response OmpR family regulator
MFVKSQISDNRTIVVAEDDQSVRNALQKILELEGFKVIAVKDGAGDDFNV